MTYENQFWLPLVFRMAGCSGDVFNQTSYPVFFLCFFFLPFQKRWRVQSWRLELGVRMRWTCTWCGIRLASSSPPSSELETGTSCSDVYVTGCMTSMPCTIKTRAQVNVINKVLSLNGKWTEKEVLEWNDSHWTRNDVFKFLINKHICLLFCVRIIFY